MTGPQGEKREHWSGRLGFILAAAGSAIGLGNIWKFPYITGENGGAAFILLYIFCIIIIGLPVMLCEMALGRKTQRNPVGAYSSVKPRSLWTGAGFLGVLAGFIILSFYSVVGGWTLGYIIRGGFMDNIFTKLKTDNEARDFYYSGNFAGYEERLGAALAENALTPKACSEFLLPMEFNEHAAGFENIKNEQLYTYFIDSFITEQSLHGWYPTGSSSGSIHSNTLSAPILKSFISCFNEGALSTLYNTISAVPEGTRREKALAALSAESVNSEHIAALYHSLKMKDTASSGIATFVAGSYFNTMSDRDKVWEVVFHIFFMLICMAIVFGGVKKGIERWSRILMPALLFILLILVIRGLTLPGARAGWEFLAKPDFSKIKGETFLIALGHAFFSLSLGMGVMVTYGSYLSKKESLWVSAIWVSVLDTAIALLAGLAIFPAVFAIGANPGAGPGLIFNTLPVVFARMPHVGWLFGILFFVLLLIAAVTSGISLLEVVTAYFVDELKMQRHTVVLFTGILITLLGIPSAINGTFFNSMDMIGSNILLPIGGLLITLFVGWAWGTKNAVDEIRMGAPHFTDIPLMSWFSGNNTVHTPDTPGITLAHIWNILIRFIAPVLIIMTFLHAIGIL